MKPRLSLRNIFVLLVILGLVIAISFLARQLLNHNIIQSSPFAKNAGEKQSLPAIVIEIRDVAEKMQINEFSLSPLFINNELLRQRSIEFLYPKRIVSNNIITIAHKSELLPSYCKLINTYNELHIYECKSN